VWLCGRVGTVSAAGSARRAPAGAGSPEVCGMARAVRSFPEDTAAEVAYAHACGKVVSDATIEAARVQTSHALRMGFEHLALARQSGVPLCPIASDRHMHARAHSPCKIALYPGHAPFFDRRRARRNLGVRFRLIRAVSTRRAGQSCTDPRSEPNRVGASPMAARARTREVLRPDRGPAVEARSPPTQMSCDVD